MNYIHWYRKMVKLKSITKPLTLSGRYFSKKELIQIQQTVKLFPKLNITELAQTLCEHIHWVTPNGINKINSCLVALEKLASDGYINPPLKRQQKKRVTKKIVSSIKTEQPSTIDCTLEDLGEVEIQPIDNKSDDSLFNEYLERYHYLGYKHPIGAALKYFIRLKDEQRTILGCLQFSSSVWHLADRDNWIGWNKKDREKRLNLVINNSRFLIFPWVNVHNLASKILSMAGKQIANDWQKIHNYRPVLIETFVDSSQYSGACYRATNWQCIGETTGKNWNSKATEQDKGSIKYIFVYPLQSNFKAILRNLKPQNEQLNIDEAFISLWGQVVGIISAVAQEFDQTWQKRQRVIDSLLLVFLIFRLVFSKNSQGYSSIINEFWFNCHKMKFPLTQKKPISASSFTDARKKLDETIFKVLNSEIIAAYENNKEKEYRWFNHRLFAVDGSKLNLPRNLMNANYSKPSDNANYPQGLLSCLYQLKSKIPYDFDLVNHSCERTCALTHLKTLQANDVVVYDRGYFSYALLYYHIQAGVYPIFRLKKKTFNEFDTFISSDQVDQMITFLPSIKTQKEINKKYPYIIFKPINVRLIKYTINDMDYYLCTTLLDPMYTLSSLKGVYHARWGIEELYKVSKQMIEVEDFHGKSERTVKQELFAHFVLITMSRLCSNESENILASFLNAGHQEKHDNISTQVNFKNCLSTVSRHLEEFMFIPIKYIKNVMNDIVKSVSRNRQTIRPNRSYVRKSMKPINKWMSCKA